MKLFIRPSVESRITVFFSSRIRAKHFNPDNVEKSKTLGFFRIFFSPSINDNGFVNVTIIVSDFNRIIVYNNDRAPIEVFGPRTVLSGLSHWFRRVNYRIEFFFPPYHHYCWKMLFRVRMLDGYGRGRIKYDKLPPPELNYTVYTGARGRRST